jgi:hypothetical protein
MTDPELIGVAGDWHRNERWMLAVIPKIARQLSGEKTKIILHAGDLGIYREEETYTWMGKTFQARTFLDAMTGILEAEDAELWFTHGNHENHPYIAELALKHDLLFGKAVFGADAKEYGWITPRVRWLPTGTRWKWHGKTWLSLGGAVSVDKNLRTPGLDWFPEEEITDAEEAEAILGGPADVILSHDAPSSEPLPLGIPPLEWLPMIPAAEAHRERVERICAEVKPSWIFHGHYHMAKQGIVQAPWGSYEYTALDMDGTRFNWGVLDTKTMDFFVPEEMP